MVIPLKDIVIEKKSIIYRDPKVLIACGGTGGHIFPALSLADVLKKRKRHTRIILATTKRQLDKRIVDIAQECQLINLSVSPPSFSFASLINLLKAGFEAFLSLIRLEPDIVVGFGGYLSAPFLLWASILKIPTLIHEQNVIPGRANYILARFVDRVAIGFKKSEEYFRLGRKSRKKIVFTGNPIRTDIKVLPKIESLKFFNLNKDRFTILVMGGSQGSHNINLKFLDTIAVIKDKKDIQVIHISGQNDYDLVRATYLKFNIPSCVFSFLKEMTFAYNASDLVVSRAGAMTIMEINFFKLPAIVIPYPFACQHQLENAKILSDEGSAIIISDNELTTDRLKEELLNLIDNPQRLTMMRETNSSLICSYGNENLSREVMTLIEEK